MSIPAPEDFSLRLEQVLLHLKEHSPELSHWMDSYVPSGTDGIDAGVFRQSDSERIGGLIYAVEQLAKRCYHLEAEIERLQSS